MIKLQADNINGIYEVEEFEAEDIQNYNVFQLLLADCDDGEVLCCTVTAEQASDLEEKYGVTYL